MKIEWSHVLKCKEKQKKRSTFKGGTSPKIFQGLFLSFWHIQKLHEKTKILVQVRAKSGHRGPRGGRFREIAENGPEIQKWPFLTIFRKFQKHGFSTIICHQNAKFGGPRVKNGHFRAKNVIFRISVNIDYLRSTNLRKSSYINEYSSFSFYPINAYDSLKRPEEACPDNV